MGWRDRAKADGLEVPPEIDWDELGTPPLGVMNETSAEPDAQFTDECLRLLREMHPAANVMGSHLSRHEKHGLVYRVDYTDPEWATRAHDRYGPVQPPSRFVFFRDDEGDLSIVSGFAFDGGPLPGCDYDLEPEYIEEPSPGADPKGETAAEPEQAMIDESLLVLTIDGMQDDLRIVSSLFSHHEQFGTVYRVDHVFGDPPTTETPFRRVFWREPDGTLRSRIDIAMNPLPTL